MPPVRKRGRPRSNVEPNLDEVSTAGHRRLPKADRGDEGNGGNAEGSARQAQEIPVAYWTHLLEIIAYNTAHVPTLDREQYLDRFVRPAYTDIQGVKDA